MKTILLGRGQKKTKVTLIDREEFEKFLEGKTIYHYDVDWISKWNPTTTPITEYFPASGFAMSSEYTLGRYNSKYSPKCLSNHTTDGKPVWELPRWKVSIRKTKKGNLYYVTRMDVRL